MYYKASLYAVAVVRGGCRGRGAHDTFMYFLLNNTATILYKVDLRGKAVVYAIKEVGEVVGGCCCSAPLG